jgi:hypothetical protein
MLVMVDASGLDKALSHALRKLGIEKEADF